MKSVHLVTACPVKTTTDFSPHADSHLKFTKILIGVKLMKVKQTFSLEGPTQNPVQKDLDLEGPMNNPPNPVYYGLFFFFNICYM